MLKHRFTPYIVGACVVVLLGVAHLSYVSYKADQNYKEWLAEMTAFQRSIEGRHDHSSHPHIHHGEKKSTATRTETREYEGDNPAFTGMTPDGDYSYDIAGRLYISNTPMSQKDIELEEWKLTGKMTSAVEEVKRHVENYDRVRFGGKVIQRVISPDGQMHQVIVPSWAQYEEGDAILESELDPPEIESAELKEKPWLSTKLVVDGVEHFPPEEYYSIEDPYEREEYFKKFDQSIQLGISMDDVEKKIAAGELDVSLSESEKRMIDEQMLYLERSNRFAPSLPPLSDKPPVKVSFLPDEGKDALPGWRRKEVGNLASGSGKTEFGGQLPATDFVPEEERYDGTRSPSFGSDVPRASPDVPDMVKPISPQSVADIEKQLTPAGIESELSEGLSPERFNNAQQLIDQYGTEEGLRRLREMDPEAARQFERERRPAPSRDVPDRGQSESGSKN